MSTCSFGKACKVMRGQEPDIYINICEDGVPNPQVLCCRDHFHEGDLCASEPGKHQVDLPGSSQVPVQMRRLLDPGCCLCSFAILEGRYVARRESRHHDHHEYCFLNNDTNTFDPKITRPRSIQMLRCGPPWATGSPSAIEIQARSSRSHKKPPTARHQTLEPFHLEMTPQ